MRHYSRQGHAQRVKQREGIVAFAGEHKQQRETVEGVGKGLLFCSELVMASGYLFFLVIPFTITFATIFSNTTTIITTTTTATTTIATLQL